MPFQNDIPDICLSIYPGHQFFVNWMLNKSGRWFVYDISVEGISLVKNYRTQFNEIMARSSYQELLKKLKEKQVPVPAS